MLLQSLTRHERWVALILLAMAGLLFELLANSLVVGSIRWPGSIDRGSCLALVDRAYERILARYESLVAEASAG